jgi:hypothetical protein
MAGMNQQAFATEHASVTCMFELQLEFFCLEAGRELHM